MVLPNTDTLVGGMEAGVGRYDPRYASPDQAECHPRWCQWDYLVLMFPCIWDGGAVSTPGDLGKGVLQRESAS